MDFYANESLGPWTVNNAIHRPVRTKKTKIKIEYEEKEKDRR